jgi:hypothetical protein
MTIPACDFPVCLICRWFDERPQIPKEWKDLCLGERRVRPETARRSRPTSNCSAVHGFES